MSGKKSVKKLGNLEWLQSLPAVHLQELSKTDWAVALLLMAGLFVTFAGDGLIHTGNQSFLYYKGFFEDFYKACYEQSGAFAVDELPSTFFAFALWNLPLYLLGRIPGDAVQSALGNVMWYKLLPVILYFAAAHWIYKIGLELRFEEKKARLCEFAFVACPVALYSTIILGQYDVFMVFFMVLGLYYYFKDCLFRFALFCGIAATFKYQVIAYFLVLLLLKEKQYRKILGYIAAAALPVALAVLPYLSSPYFQRCALRFYEERFVSSGFDLGFISGVNLGLAVEVYLMIWAYTRRISGKEEFTSWALFLCNGVSFAVFGFIHWDPNWFLMMIPFLVFSIFMNRHGKAHLLLLNIFTVTLYVFGVNQWSGVLDETMIRHGIFKGVLGGRQFSVSMAEVYGYDRMDVLGTILFIILLAHFIFNHPKYQSLRHTEIQPHMMNHIRVTFLVGVLAFIIPAFFCLGSTMRGKTAFLDNTETDVEACKTVAVTDSAKIIQSFEADGTVLTEISVRLKLHDRINDGRIEVKVRRAGSKKTIYEGTVDTGNMVREDEMYCIAKGRIPVEKGERYELILKGNQKKDSCVSAYYRSVSEKTKERVQIQKENDPSQLIMKIRGVER